MSVANSEIDDWKQKSLYIIDQVKQSPYAKYFLEPVHEINDSAPGYYYIITDPMNIKQLKSELMNGTIKSPQQFLLKFSLIWENSFIYNGQKHHVSVAAKKIRSKVMHLFRTRLADSKFSHRLIINPGIRRSIRLRKEMNDQVENYKDHRLRKEINHQVEHKEKESDNIIHPDVYQKVDIYQNKQFVDQIIKQEHDTDEDLPPPVLVSHHNQQNVNDQLTSIQSSTDDRFREIDEFIEQMFPDPDKHVTTENQKDDQSINHQIVSSSEVPLLESSDDAKCQCKIYEEKIKQLNLRISELNEELQSTNQQKQDQKEAHSNRIKELRAAYTKLHNAFNRVTAIVNDINAFIMHQTNIANNIC